MSGLSPNLRGIIYMVLATGFFIVNDTFLKLATEGLPPFETMFLRGVSGALWCLPLIIATGNLRKLPTAWNGWVVARGVGELAGILCFILALKHVALADLTAINMTTPLLLLLGCAIFFGDRLGALQLVLIAIGFVGAILVAQPSAKDASPYLLLGFACAFAGATRDLAGRKIGWQVPTLVVAYATILIGMVGSGIAHVLFEEWQAPTREILLYEAGAGLFLTIGQFLLFLSYRTGATGAVAPFLYTFAVWAVISGIVVFGVLPNALALVGIALIVASGVLVALHDERKRRLAITT